MKGPDKVIMKFMQRREREKLGGGSGSGLGLKGVIRFNHSR